MPTKTPNSVYLRTVYCMAGRTHVDRRARCCRVRTADLPSLLADGKPVVIDIMTNLSGRSISGAVGLKFVGPGGDFLDEEQDRLRSKSRELTGGDLGRPIAAVGWNPERFDGRNL